VLHLRLVDLEVPPNTACTRPPHEHRGRDGGSLRVFKRFSWLEVDSVKLALSRPTHQRVTHTVRRTIRESEVKYERTID